MVLFGHRAPPCSAGGAAPRCRRPVDGDAGYDQPAPPGREHARRLAAHTLLDRRTPRCRGATSCCAAHTAHRPATADPEFSGPEKPQRLGPTYAELPRARRAAGLLTAARRVQIADTGGAATGDRQWERRALGPDVFKQQATGNRQLATGNDERLVHGAGTPTARGSAPVAASPVSEIHRHTVWASPVAGCLLPVACWLLLEAHAPSIAGRRARPRGRLAWNPWRQLSLPRCDNLRRPQGVLRHAHALQALADPRRCRVRWR